MTNHVRELVYTQQASSKHLRALPDEISPQPAARGCRSNASSPHLKTSSLSRTAKKTASHVFATLHPATYYCLPAPASGAGFSDLCLCVGPLELQSRRALSLFFSPSSRLAIYIYIGRGRSRAKDISASPSAGLMLLPHHCSYSTGNLPLSPRTRPHPPPAPSSQPPPPHLYQEPQSGNRKQQSGENATETSAETSATPSTVSPRNPRLSSGSVLVVLWWRWC